MFCVSDFVLFEYTSHLIAVEILSIYLKSRDEPFKVSSNINVDLSPY